MHIFDCVFIYPNKLVLQLLLWIIFFSIKRKHITNLLYLIPLVLFIPPCVSNLSSGVFLFSLKNFSVSYRLGLLATNSFNFFYTWEYFHFNFISEWMFHLIYNSGFSFFCSSTLCHSVIFYPPPFLIRSPLLNILLFPSMWWVIFSGSFEELSFIILTMLFLVMVLFLLTLPVILWAICI